MALQIMTALPGGWTQGYLHLAAATETLTQIIEVGGFGGTKPDFSSDSVLKVDQLAPHLQKKPCNETPISMAKKTSPDNTQSW